MKPSTNGTIKIDFDKQVLKLNLKKCKKIKKLTCDEAYHLWDSLNTIFTTEEAVKKIKVYNLFNEEINLLKTLKASGKIKNT